MWWGDGELGDAALVLALRLTDFIITPPDNGKIITSEDSYFYDYNAVKAAKVKIDELFK